MDAVETDPKISRLGPDQAEDIVACFRRVYGESYANEIFYDTRALADAFASGRLGSVGALGEGGDLLGHMAMTVRPEATVVELGNTVVDPRARGSGLAWKIGAELSAWCRELGFTGFLHYPTTDHHIMQRQSVKAGFETGLMLGYIPEETHGKVRTSASHRRQAATIVYEPYGPGPAAASFLPEPFADLVRRLAAPTGLPRTWKAAAARPAGRTQNEAQHHRKRRLHRLLCRSVGADIDRVLAEFSASPEPCLQIDFRMADAALDHGVEAAIGLGFRFCGWLPGFCAGDVLRLQRVDERVTEMVPGLVNPVARSLLDHAASVD